jgi:hypothetical protein
MSGPDREFQSFIVRRVTPVATPDRQWQTRTDCRFGAFHAVGGAKPARAGVARASQKRRAPNEVIMTRPLTLSAAFVALTATDARAAEPAQPVLAHLEVVEGKSVQDHVVGVAPSSEGLLDVDTAGPNVTRVRLRYLQPRDGAAELAYEVKHVGADKSSWAAAGEVTPPAPGKRVLVARVPQPTGAVELYLTLVPYPR